VIRFLGLINIEIGIIEIIEIIVSLFVGKAVLAAMQEALAKQREEEERLLRFSYLIYLLAVLGIRIRNRIRGLRVQQQKFYS
jgi:hypothetical protein